MPLMFLPVATAESDQTFSYNWCGKNVSSGIHNQSLGLLQQSAVRYRWLSVASVTVHPECGGATVIRDKKVWSRVSSSTWSSLAAGTKKDLLQSRNPDVQMSTRSSSVLLTSPNTAHQCQLSKVDVICGLRPPSWYSCHPIVAVHLLWVVQLSGTISGLPPSWKSWKK
jgi:hypothetical protein